MNITCSANPCPIILSSSCVFYEGANLIYTGITTNDSIQTALEKIDATFGRTNFGYVFQNGITKLSSNEIELGGSLLHNTYISGLYTLQLQGFLKASRFITTGGTSSSFVKGDGTLDSTMYQPVGNYITNLIGDVTASGPGSVTATLATVNANTGTYGSSVQVPVINVDGKGRILSVSAENIDFPSGSLDFIGDVSGSGTTGSPVTLTLATVNGDVYTTNTVLKFTVNAKGLVTSASPVTASDIDGILTYTPVPNSRTLTINGVTQDLSADRSWTFPVGGVLQYNDISDFPSTGDSVQLYVATDTNLSYYWNGTSYVNINIFNHDIVVSLSGGKTLGRYLNGDTIPAAGKTAEQVLNLIAQEPIAPTVTLSSPTTIQFNQIYANGGATIVLDFSYIINSLGASVSTVSLDWSRDDSTWTTLSTNTSITTFNHNVTDTQFNTTPFYYRYIVTDTQGATNTATYNVTPTAYVAPSTTLTQVASSLNGPQTNTLREIGNISTYLTSSNVTRNSTYVNLISYQVQYNTGSGWNNLVGASGSLPSAGGSPISPYTDGSLSTSISSVQYRIQIVDQYSSSTYYYSSTVTFLFLYLYGYSTTNGLLSDSQIYGLGNGSLQNTVTRTLYPVTAPVGNWTYIAILHSIGTISNIIQDGATPVYGAFNNAPYASSVTVTNQYGVQGLYDLYKSNASNAFTNNSLAIT